MEFKLLKNVKMPTIIGILTFIGKMNTTSECIKHEKTLFSSIISVFIISIDTCSWEK